MGYEASEQPAVLSIVRCTLQSDRAEGKRETEHGILAQAFQSRDRRERGRHHRAASPYRLPADNGNGCGEAHDSIEDGEQPDRWPDDAVAIAWLRGHPMQRRCRALA